MLGEEELRRGLLDDVVLRGSLDDVRRHRGGREAHRLHGLLGDHHGLLRDHHGLLLRDHHHWDRRRLSHLRLGLRYGLSGHVRHLGGRLRCRQALVPVGLDQLWVGLDGLSDGWLTVERGDPLGHLVGLGEPGSGPDGPEAGGSVVVNADRGARPLSGGHGAGADLHDADASGVGREEGVAFERGDEPMQGGVRRRGDQDPEFFGLGGLRLRRRLGKSRGRPETGACRGQADRNPETPSLDYSHEWKNLS